MEKILSMLSKINKRLDKIETSLGNNLDGKSRTKTKSKKVKVQKYIESDEDSSKKCGRINLTVYKDFIIIKGDTYDKKTTIKKYKGYWEPSQKGWVVPIKNYKKISKSLKKTCESVNESSINEYFKQNTESFSKPTHESGDLGDSFAFLSDD